jgi:hypothetical protein
MYIFLDESGDLGFSENSSKWFLFTMAVIDDPRKLEHVIKKIRKTLNKKHKRKHSELHSYHVDTITRKRVLKALVELDISVVTIILNKEKVYIGLKDQKNHLYNYTANILLDRFINTNLIDDEHNLILVVDRKYTKKNLQNNFIAYITKAMQKRRKGGFTMSLAASHDEKGLQAVDFISWAIFRKYEQGDYEYYEIIKEKIIDERLLFP